MSFRAAVIVFAAFIIFAAVGFGALDAANADAERGIGQETQVEEAFSGATTGYDVAGGTDNDTYSAPHEIVVEDSGGTELANNKYKWDSDNGTLTTTSTSSGNITYSFYEPSATTSGVLNLASLPLEIGDALLWFFFAFIAIAALIVLKGVAT